VDKRVDTDTLEDQERGGYEKIDQYHPKTTQSIAKNIAPF